MHKTDTFEKQIQIAVFTLIISLGYFKISELTEFMDFIANSINNLSLLSAIFVAIPIILYFIYILSIGLGLYRFFTKKSGIEDAMILALGSFFGFYILILIRQLNATQINIPF